MENVSCPGSLESIATITHIDLNEVIVIDVCKTRDEILMSGLLQLYEAVRIPQGHIARPSGLKHKEI
jgi:hypothetical protein